MVTLPLPRSGEGPEPLAGLEIRGHFLLILQGIGGAFADRLDEVLDAEGYDDSGVSSGVEVFEGLGTRVAQVLPLDDRQGVPPVADQDSGDAWL